MRKNLLCLPINDFYTKIPLYKPQQKKTPIKLEHEDCHYAQYTRITNVVNLQQKKLNS